MVVYCCPLLGYEQFKGQVLEAAELDVLIDGLHSNDLLRYTHILTGLY